MSLPVSQYEALLAEVRGLRRKAQHVQQLARPLLPSDSSQGASFSDIALRDLRSSPDRLSPYYQTDGPTEPLDYTMESLLLGRQINAVSSNYENGGLSSSVDGGDTTCSEDDEYACRGGGSGSSAKLSVSSEPPPQRNRRAAASGDVASLYHGTWPVEKTMWNSEPAGLGSGVPLDRVLGSPDSSKWSSQQLEAKMDVVHSLLAMLGGQEHVDMGETLLALSTCCIPLLVKLVQSDRDGDTRIKAGQALHNLVHSQPDEKLRKRESRVLKLLGQCKHYTEALRNNTEYEQIMESGSFSSEDGDKHPVQTVAHLMKLSFDEGHRQAICLLGGIHTIASLVEVEHTLHGSTWTDTHCLLMRRYACMALTNLTFGDSGNKALLCSYREFMRALVVQLQSPSDELRQVTASVLRNLSWRADSTSKEILKEVGSVTGLMKASMLDNKENTLKSILSALWNLSAHCTENKSEICAVEGALGFLVDMLTYKTPTKSLAIIENTGGILRNISSQIAVREDFRETLRQHNCLQILLDQLKSPSLTIVSNACGTLWNLSAKCVADQEALWRMGAPSMLRSLNHSKHKMIAMGSSAALKNLLSAKPQQVLQPQLDSTALSLDLPVLPTLGARKQKALLQDLDQSLSETYENIEKDSPIKKDPDFQDNRRKSKGRPSSPDENRLSNNFASLSLNEPSTSYTSELRLQSRIPQSYGSSSLPYLNPPIKHTNPFTYIPVRNKFSDCAYEDEIDISDQPIDYSKKYSETKLPNREADEVCSSKDRDYSFGKQPKKETFSIYAETDLDQPTDYSLRYAEDDSDSEICDKKTEYVQDTVKTYCTEDTPYETPFNFSTATSMSDLRLDDKSVIDNDKLKETVPKVNKENSENLEEKDRCSTEDISDCEAQTKLVDKIPKSELSSGLLSPEKPVNYAEEGTPGYFSRVSSFGSITSIPANEKLKNIEESGLESERVPDTKPAEKVFPKTPTETKNVKFERVVNYAEETPLMFSRSSSLASLDSIEQHSIHDDRSSVVSDFSRLPSGIVSPSELPDSPTQTVPPSPKPRKTPMDFPTTSKPRPPEHALRLPPKTSDSVSKRAESSGCSEEEAQKDEETEKKDAEKETTASDINDEESEDDADESILADCINIGMQTSTNRNNQVIPNNTSTPSKLPLSSFKYAPKTSRDPPKQPASSSEHCDTLRTYCTEDTPARLSHAGSNSDLSVLSISNDKGTPKKGGYFSDDSSNMSDNASFSQKQDGWQREQSRRESLSSISVESLGSLEADQALLEQCISSGMPKSIPDTRTKPLDIPEPRSDQRRSMGKQQSRERRPSSQPPHSHPPHDASPTAQQSKNANAASAAGSTPPPPMTSCIPEAPIAAAGVALRDARFDDIVMEDRLAKSCEDSRAMDHRMLDPAAMIESLDRFTAELVSQASHLNKEKGSTGENTWNEDTSPNESFHPVDVPDAVNEPSNDFSSINTSTMTDSTLIAIEASKIATVFQNEAEMSLSITSINSLELDRVQPPSQMTSLTNSTVGLEKNLRSPKLLARKKSLVRRALSNSINHGSSLESLDNHSLSNLDHINPPSDFLYDMEGSMTSVASLPSEGEVRGDFVINGVVQHPIFNVKLPFGELGDINPPSLTLQDVTLAEDDLTLFSDAVSGTPQQSDVSSLESTPKKAKHPSKSMTTKQRRNLARDRSRFETQVLDEAVTSSLHPPAPPSDSLSRSHASISPASNSPASSSPAHSPARTKHSIRRSFMQKRLENKDRFRTQTVSESGFSPDDSSSGEVRLHLQKEADRVLRTLRDTKTTQDDLLDCETISLVSNDDDDSEYNSGGSVNYRTYHKSWGIRTENVPVIGDGEEERGDERVPDSLGDEANRNSEDEDEDERRVVGKPKIVKPNDSPTSIGNKVAPKSIKPVKTMTSNLVKNVTSTLKNGTTLKSVVSRQNKTAQSRPTTGQSVASSGYGSSPSSTTTTTPKASSKIPTAACHTKIPTFGSKIAKAVLPARPPPNSSKPPNANKPPTVRNGNVKSASSDRAGRGARVYNRSTSADSRDSSGGMRASPSTQSLKGEGRMGNGAMKKSSSNSSLNSNGSGGAKKLVTSKIASLWKKIEDSKKLPPKKDSRVWIQADPEPPRLIRSNTFDNKDSVILRNSNSPSEGNGDSVKRISRLGSFVVMDENGVETRLPQATDAGS
ncbi:unnamed protein product [Phaedon cochleariae]|uniref:Adenomatous polyposis coli protein n=1 Tax=Phaedon cochleariae TaxID=80249 RepID=A0A9P0GVI4_PHACE|nr:unnamed protein product [Phaedon cochleariae]